MHVGLSEATEIGPNLEWSETRRKRELCIESCNIVMRANAAHIPTMERVKRR